MNTLCSQKTQYVIASTMKRIPKADKNSFLSFFRDKKDSSKNDYVIF